MSETYLDLDVVVERSGSAYRVRARTPAGEAESLFTPAFSEEQLAALAQSADTQAAKDLGGRLFEQVFAGEVGRRLDSSANEAQNREAGLRIRLHLTAVPELGALPWEYLYDARLNRFLALSAQTPVVRYLSLPERARSVRVSPPLQVLVMISNPSNVPELDVEREWRALQEALSELEGRGLVRLERLREPTFAGLQARLRGAPVHVFHFVGHGAFDPGAEEGTLVLQDESARGRPVSAEQLGALLRDAPSVRLAVLNACEGARSGRTDPFAGTAPALVQQGVPAVIAQQFEVTDEAAVTLARELYRALADGCPVDAALAEARKAVFADGTLEWGTPVLYMRAGDGRILDTAAPLLPKPAVSPMRLALGAALVLGVGLAAVNAPEWLGPARPSVTPSPTPSPERPAVQAFGTVVSPRSRPLRDVDVTIDSRFFGRTDANGNFQIATTLAAGARVRLRAHRGQSVGFDDFVVLGSALTVPFQE